MTIAEQIRQKGREEGRIEALSSMLMKLVKNRFGNISAAIERKLGESDVDMLDKFGESIFDFKDLSDAERWLETQS